MRPTDAVAFFETQCRINNNTTTMMCYGLTLMMTTRQLKQAGWSKNWAINADLVPLGHG